MTRPSPHSVLGMAMIAAVFAVNVYRAAHQSITADEAFTWDLYITNPLNWIFVVYDANNHVLHTLLCRLSVQLLGLSELTMRLPSLAGGLLYLAFVYKLCRLLFVNFWTFLLAMAALTLNPFLMDYLSAARGYGMALGFLTAALYLVLRFFDDGPEAANPNRATVAAVLLGLAISANLVFLFPAIAVAITITPLRIIGAPARAWSRILLWAIGRFWLPLAAPAVLFLAMPLAHAKKDAFYYGGNSLLETTLSVVQQSFFHPDNAWRADTTPAIIIRSIDVIGRWVVPAILALVFAALIPVGLRWWRARDFHALSVLDRAYVVIALVLAISLGLLMAAHSFVGMAYPLDRTAIYLVAMFTLACMLLIAYGRNTPIRLLASVPAILALAMFLRGFTTSYYYVWRYDAGTKRIFHLLEGHPRFNPGKPMRVGADWRFDPSLNFYRQMYHADWLAKVLRDPPPEAGGFDYYVLLPEDEESTRKLGLRVIYRDPISDQQVALPVLRGASRQRTRPLY